jgi:aspartyl-tRNA(Asn)/glutamyl-tRNA(Gln) amidotransferase subunit A
LNFRGGPPIIPAGNLVGQPALSVVNGFGPNNLPTGIQFTGKVWSEARLLSIAHAYQQATDWHRRRPNLDK